MQAALELPFSFTLHRSARSSRLSLQGKESDV